MRGAVLRGAVLTRPTVSGRGQIGMSLMAVTVGIDLEYGMVIFPSRRIRRLPLDITPGTRNNGSFQN
jgi:hypothetical protein